MERFEKPTDEELVKIAVIFNDGEINREQIGNMVAMTSFVIDRLHEHGTIKKKSSKEIQDDNE